jgi:putative nucleotidyltransferase with HDIG domain
MGLFYRIRQTWDALTAKPENSDLQEVKEFLPPSQFSLFIGLHTSEQSHSIAVYRQLLENGASQPDLLTAALLHDVGKNRYPIHFWDRIFIVLGKGVAPSLIESWGAAEPDSWKRPFVVSQKHAGWGAQMAAAAGATQLTVELINRHQEQILTEDEAPSNNHKITNPPKQTEDQLLALLQLYDNKN